MTLPFLVQSLFSVICIKYNRIILFDLCFVCCVCGFVVCGGGGGGGGGGDIAIIGLIISSLKIPVLGISNWIIHSFVIAVISISSHYITLCL